MDTLWAWALSSGVKIVLIIVLAVIARAAGALLIRRVFATMMESGTKISSMTNAVIRRPETHAAAALAKERREQRANTLSTVAKNVLGLVIAVLATVMILSEVGINVAPVIAGLGVAGLAAGIGAQTIIKDFIAGVVMLFEDIVAVGDVVDLEYATGTVENVNLRVTQVRSLDGGLWTVRNGEIIRVGNMSRGFATAVVMLDLDTSNDDAHVTDVLTHVAEDAMRDENLSEVIMDTPKVSGILSFDGARYQRRITAKVAPGRQWDVEQDLRRRVRREFHKAGIAFALPRFQETKK